MDQPTASALVVIGPVKPRPKSAAADSPLPMDEPAMEMPAEPITIDLTAIDTSMASPHGKAAATDEAAPSAFAATVGRWKTFAPLAASLIIATLVGAAAGAAAIYSLSGTASVSQHVATMSDEARALQGQVASLVSEMRAFESGIESASRDASGQFGKIAARLDRVEKTQVEPAKIAKLSEGLDRLERRMASAAPLDITGSVTTVQKQQAKPAVVEGWQLLDYYAGRAVLVSRNGTLFQVRPGANLPGIGKIETIKRVDGRVVVTTPKGIIVSELDTPRPHRRPLPYYLPRGY